MRTRSLIAALAFSALALALLPASRAGAETAAQPSPPANSGAAPAPQATAPAGSAPSAIGAPPATAPTSAPAAPEERLSNETTLTTWAHPVEEMSIFTRPDVHSRRVARVHLLTEDGFPEVYALLASRVVDGTTWIRMPIPGRPNGRVGWVLREALGGLHETHWRIVVNLGERRLTALYDGRRRFVAPVGVGKPSTPTPTGHFWIRERFRLTSRSNPYWPYALGTSDYSTLSEWPGGGVIGIHGDFGEPEKIPGDPSHGCVRMHDSDIAWLAPRITLGTPVEIVR
ncbi:MAG TPA: L,D-transpeptidase [Solirubrobacteraceae bacterium]|nr:L,D-transpeptidase [Solirubrobacteraceae bacterium]HME04367.1 L,D-transpeptidase [Solirubrobacteraceae bacterium]